MSASAVLTLTAAVIVALSAFEARAQEIDLPPGLAEEAGADHSGDAVEGGSITDAAMGQASWSYVSEDYRSARLHAERAAAAGEPRGATLAGHLRLHGLGVEADDAAAVRWFRRAGEQNEPDALVILGQLASEGRGGLQPLQAQDFYRRAAETGDSRGALAYGRFLMARNDPSRASEALDWLRLAAEAGDAEAYGVYAAALDDWPLGPNDPAQARDWYERAGEAGDAASALQAGLMAMTGEGGPEDPEHGAALIRAAAELGLPAAMGQHALIAFQSGDSARAARWAERGALGGDAESQFLYAYALATGDGAAQDLEQAYVWTLRAGYPREDSLDGDPQRDQLEARLAQALPEDARARLEAEAREGMVQRYALNPDL